YIKGVMSIIYALVDSNTCFLQKFPFGCVPIRLVRIDMSFWNTYITSFSLLVIRSHQKSFKRIVIDQEYSAPETWVDTSNILRPGTVIMRLNRKLFIKKDDIIGIKVSNPEVRYLGF